MEKKEIPDYLSPEHKASLGLHDKGMCVCCVNGACVPSEVSYNGAKLTVQGCVAAILHFNFPNIIKHPELLCSCFYKYGEQRHPKHKFTDVKLTQVILPPTNEIGAASSGLAMVDKAVVDDPTQ